METGCAKGGWIISLAGSSNMINRCCFWGRWRLQPLATQRKPPQRLQGTASIIPDPGAATHQINGVNTAYKLRASLFDAMALILFPFFLFFEVE
jgi:hypothetical protein